MSRLKQLKKYRKHLEKRYTTLLEKTNDYMYEDESKSDRAAYKAMKILDKINRISYLDKDAINVAS